MEISAQIFMLIYAATLTLCDNFDASDKSKWIDPHDMINYDISSGQMRKSGSGDVQQGDHSQESNPSGYCEDLQKQANACAQMVAQLRQELENKATTPCAPPHKTLQLDTSPYFQQFVKHLLWHFQEEEQPNGEDGEKNVYQTTIHLSKQDVHILQKFNPTEHGSVIETHAVLTAMIHKIEKMGHYQPVLWRTWLVDQVSQHMPLMLQASMVLFLVSLAIRWQVQMGASLLLLLLRLIVFLFFISIPWNWWHLVQIEMAKRQTDGIKGIPDQCRPGSQPTFMQTVTSYFSMKDDPCYKYTQMLMVNPIWEVPPTKAIAVTIANFVLEPLEHLGRHLGRFIRAALADLPLHLQPVVLLLLVVIVLMVVVMIFGYRIKLFHLIGLEPSHSMPALQNLQHRAGTAMLQDIVPEPAHFQRSLSQPVSLMAAETLASSLTTRDAVDGAAGKVEKPVQLSQIEYPQQQPTNVSNAVSEVESETSRKPQQPDMNCTCASNSGSRGQVGANGKLTEKSPAEQMNEENATLALTDLSHGVESSTHLELHNHSNEQQPTEKNDTLNLISASNGDECCTSKKSNDQQVDQCRALDLTAASLGVETGMGIVVCSNLVGGGDREEVASELAQVTHIGCEGDNVPEQPSIVSNSDIPADTHTKQYDCGPVEDISSKVCSSYSGELP